MLDHHVEVGNPADAPMLVPAIKRITVRAGRIPPAVTADRGYVEAAVDDELGAVGVERVAIPVSGMLPGTPVSWFTRIVARQTWSRGVGRHLDPVIR